MAIKPVRARRPGGKPTDRLMDMQDTRHKGDGRGGDKVMMTFMIPADLRQELRERADELGTSSARLILDGIRMRLGQDD